VKGAREGRYVIFFFFFAMLFEGTSVQGELLRGGLDFPCSAGRQVLARVWGP